MYTSHDHGINMHKWKLVQVESRCKLTLFYGVCLYCYPMCNILYNFFETEVSLFLNDDLNY